MFEFAKKTKFCISMLLSVCLVTPVFTAMAYESEETKLNHDFSLGFPDTPYFVTEGTTEQIFDEYRKSIPEEMKLFDPYVPDGQTKIYVAPDGSDKNSGTFEKPFATLDAAVAKLKSAPRTKGAVIYLRGGSYSIEKTLTLTEEISGTEKYPIFISSYNGEDVKMYAAKTATLKAVNAAEDSLVQKKIDSKIRDKIMKIDCSSLNVNYQITTESGEPIVKIAGNQYNIARWPNNSYTTFSKYNESDGENGVINTGDVLAGTNGDKPFSEPFEFKMSSFRPTTWENTGDIFIYGRMNTEYLWERFNVDSINSEIPSLRSKTPAREGCKYNGTNNIYYFYNVMEELDTPGEYFFETNSNTLYYYPSSDTNDNEDVSVFIPESADDLIVVSGANNIVFNGIDFGYGSNSAIKIKSGEKNVIQNCKFRNFGNYAIQLGGRNNGIIYSQFLENDSNVLINRFRSKTTNDFYTNSYDRYTRHFLQNNYFQNSTSSGGHVIALYGSIQTVVSHNTFLSDSNINLYSGNRQCVFEYNQFISPKSRVADGAAIYTGGNFDQTENVYRCNYFRRYVADDVHNSNIGIYLDDLGCTSHVYKNIFVDCRLYYHGGSNHMASNNIFIGIDKQKEAAYTNSVNYYVNVGGMSAAAEQNFTMQPNTKGESKTVNLMNEINEKWDYRYNDLLAMYRDVRMQRSVAGENYVRSELENYVRSAKYNVCKRNVFFRRPAPVMLESEYECDYSDNYVTDDDPGFVDAKNYNFDLKNDSIVYEKIPGFEKMPSMENIGIIFGKGAFKNKLHIEKANCISPANDTNITVSNTNLKLSWTPPFGSAQYKVQISEMKDFSAISDEHVLTGCYTQYSVPELKFDTVYYWRVFTYANSNSFAEKESVSDVFSFRTCKANEVYLFEELNTDPLKNKIIDINAQKKYIYEDEGIDLGFGLYKKGTKQQIESLVSTYENLLKKIKRQSEVDKLIEKLESEYLKIICDNAIEYNRKLNDFSLNTWKLSSDNIKVDFSKDKSSVKLTPDKGTATLLLKQPLSPKESVSFRIKFDHLPAGWPCIANRMLSDKENSPWDSDGYFIAFSNALELQKIKDGKRGDERIIKAEDRIGDIPTNEWLDVYLLTETTAEGVHVVLKLNGETFLDVLDTENPVKELGFLAFKLSKNEPIIEISTPKN